MNTNFHQRLTGTLFIIGAVLVNVPYTLLIMTSRSLIFSAQNQIDL